MLAWTSGRQITKCAGEKHWMYMHGRAWNNSFLSDFDMNAPSIWRISDCVAVQMLWWAENMLHSMDILHRHLVSDFISLVTSCLGLEEEEPQTAHPKSLTCASHIAASELTGMISSTQSTSLMVSRKYVIFHQYLAYHNGTTIAFSVSFVIIWIKLHSASTNISKECFFHIPHLPDIWIASFKTNSWVLNSSHWVEIILQGSDWLTFFLLVVSENPAEWLLLKPQPRIEFEQSKWSMLNYLG